ncbi:MAG TPA: hypothetical protein VJ728_00295 [Candidatus Binataceae bacterium]|nr:hypothetical protein [Candidatus Binataceae bacterium]
MLSGRQALSSIERTILDLRSEQNRIGVMLQSATEESVRLHAQRAENFKALAAIELDSLARDQLSGELDAVERRALALVEQRRQRLAEIADRRSKALGDANATQTEHARWAAAVEAARDHIDQLTVAVETRVKSEQDWVSQQQRVEQTKAKATAAADKAAQAEADRKNKGQPYENDPLFTYLWKSEYGTPRYRAGLISRYFDGKVAKLVGYDTAQANYRMLTEIPLRLREHADRLAQDADAEVAKRTVIERRALEAEGIVTLEKALDTAEKNLTRSEEHLARAKDELTALDADQSNAKDEAGDPDYQQALQLLTDRLSREDLGKLYEKARHTPNAEDDRIVQSLQQQEQAIAQVDGQIQEIRKTSIELARKRADLEQSRSRFQQAGYDDPLGGFVNGALIGTILGSILNGSRSSGTLDNVFNDGFRRRLPPSNGGFGGISFPSGGSPSGGGGFRTGGDF